MESGCYEQVLQFALALVFINFPCLPAGIGINTDKNYAADHDTLLYNQV